MTRPTLLATTLAALALLQPAAAAEPLRPAPQPVVQIALLLDTSNSMDGLIGQAKAQLWKVVNTFAGSRRDGARPELQIALYEYGKQSLPVKERYIRLVLPFTTDLDLVSQQLFALTTNGGDEYCGAVIQRSAQELAWRGDPAALRLLFIAGNEPFSQGPVPYSAAIAEAVARGIGVHTIFCGSGDASESATWRDGARLAGGSFLAIDQNLADYEPACPQDPELARLGAELNGTYVAYGALAVESKARQAAQDHNAVSSGAPAAAQRAMSKASVLYDNSRWDLVDAQKRGVKVEAIPDAELPPELRGKGPAERKAYVERQAKERERLQARITQLSRERETWLTAERKQRAGASAETLDSAMIKVVKEAGRRTGLVFE
jgi:hypothetical protein